MLLHCWLCVFLETQSPLPIDCAVLPGAPATTSAKPTAKVTHTEAVPPPALAEEGERDWQADKVWAQRHAAESCKFLLGPVICSQRLLQRVPSCRVRGHV